MSGKNIDKILNKAYKKIGKVMGFDFKMYRSVDYLDPVQDKNYVKNVTLAFSLDESFKSQEEFSFKVYNLWVDGANILPGDIFISEDLNKRFTLVSNEQITVPLGLDSSSNITISRPTYSNTGGFGPKQIVIADKIPCKILEAKAQPSTGNMTERTPYKSGIQVWDIWFYLDKEVKINDTLLHSDGSTSTIESIQVTPLGWKAKAVSTKV